VGVRFSIFALAVLVAWGGAAAAETLATVTIGVVPSVPAGATYIAIEKGYFREAGIEVKLENIESAAAGIAMLATNRMQVVEGGVAAGFWNALARDMPVIMALERGTSPLYHDVILRNELVGIVKIPADLKGRPVATVAPGSSGVYEVGKFLEANGLTIQDVDLKYVAFTQMGAALANKAIDAAFEVPPFGEILAAQHLGTKWLDPEDYITTKPLSFIGYLANTDWAAQNPDLAKRFFLALVRGGRDYCQAYHHGPNRAEMEDVLWKYKASDNRALLHTMAWQARDPNGHFAIASILDLQDWFLKQGLIDRKFPIDRLIDASYADYAEKTLPPFEVINKDSKLAGCR
jgi:NitT/TauT family transport system substrate-binding protein